MCNWQRAYVTAANGIDFEEANYLQTELNLLGIECKR
jgi:hypothetical protein